MQQIFGFLSLDQQMSNFTAPHAFNATAPQLQSHSSSPSLISFLLAFPALRDWAKLIVIGGVLETIRRSFFSTWDSLVNAFFITAQFKEDDSSYDWMMVWLSKQPSWSAFIATLSTLNKSKLTAVCHPRRKSPRSGDFHLQLWSKLTCHLCARRRRGLVLLCREKLSEARVYTLCFCHVLYLV